MLRRKFLGAMATLGAGSLASFAAAKTGTDDGGVSKEITHVGQHRTVSYAVQGFTCITCAVGLEVLLRQEKGVLAAHAEYSAAIARIEFDPAIVTDMELRAFIEDAGFRVSPAIG